MSTQLTSANKNGHLLSNILNLYMANDNLIHQNLSFILDIILNHRLFSTSTESDELTAVYRKWTVRLNAILQSKNTVARWCAVKLIRVTCENSHALLLSNAKTWSAQLLGFVGKSEPTAVHQESIETLTYLFAYTADKPELQREIATPNLQRYNQLLIQLGRKQELLPVVLAALTTNIRSFPSTARHIAEPCLQLCLSCLDGSKDYDANTIKRANDCLVSLYIAGGKAQMADQWKESLSRLIGSVHECLNRLFDTVDEESLESELPKSYPFLSVPSDYVDAFPILLRRIQLIQESISVFLTTSTSVAVGVPIAHLIDLICRIYNVSEGSLMREFKDKSEFFTLVMCLPALHLSTCKMVTSLLYCSGSEMIRYNKLFSRILLRLLNEHRHKRTLKIAVYQLMSLCIGKCGYTFAESVHKPLIAAVLQDLQIIEHKATISTQPQQSQQQQQKHKKRKTDVTNSDALTSKTVSATPADVQVAAIGALTALVEVYGFAMDNGQRASVDSLILSRLIQIIPASDLSEEDVILIKSELYQCLIASVTHPIETQASILPHAARLFSAGTNDASHELQMICKKGSTVCDLIMHSRLPPVQRTMPKSVPTVAITVQEQHVESEDEEMIDQQERTPEIVDERVQEEEVEEENEEEAEQEEEEEKKKDEEKKKEEVVEQLDETKISQVTTETVENQTTIVAVNESSAKETLPAQDEAAEKPLVSMPVTIEEKKIEIETTTRVPVAPIENKQTFIDLTSDSNTPTPKLNDMDLNFDMDMDMPAIDLAGPDTDDEDD
ncbi:Pre-rRNA-processing protein rix1 [Choanephora cucurbitarum]|uniref:Pre-rRNA-processing protein RIX1 n=1 Tax=Choanephora cucurbitarum TaxID=101091 RepID=A0A1C7NNG7_9FUNG|nr:Pre-rRNA-processing protein rix1 [Choanephora cucurbitarum]